MTTTILIIVNVFAALAIIVLALMQQSKGDMGSAFGGGGSQSMFGSRGSANFLSRTTSIMCAVFFISSLSLAYVYAKRAESNSVVGSSVLQQSTEVPSIESEIPTIESDIPSIDSSEVPSIDVDTAETVESVENAAAEIEQSVESAINDVPAVPEQ